MMPLKLLSVTILVCILLQPSISLTPISSAVSRRTPVTTTRSEKGSKRQLQIHQQTFIHRSSSTASKHYNLEASRVDDADRKKSIYNNRTTHDNSMSNNAILVTTACGYLMSVFALSEFQLLGSSYTHATVTQDFGVTAVTTVLSLIFVKVITKLSAMGVLQPRDSRKIIHTLSAPLFMLFWPLFSHEWGARLMAGFVPFLQAVRLWLAGTRSIDDNELSNAISRSGEKQEALGGPFIYVVILIASIVLCFCDSLSGVIALSTMAAGDGMADILGRRFGKNNKWFFSESKSIAGTFGFIASAALCSIGLSAWLIHTNAIAVAMPFGAIAARICFISAVSSIIELLPFADDNWTVPISAGVLASLLIA